MGLVSFMTDFMNKHRSMNIKIGIHHSKTTNDSSHEYSLTPKELLEFKSETLSRSLDPSLKNWYKDASEHTLLNSWWLNKHWGTCIAGAIGGRRHLYMITSCIFPKDVFHLWATHTRRSTLPLQTIVRLAVWELHPVTHLLGCNERNALTDPADGLQCENCKQWLSW
jgi:hypothetical protein